MDQKPPLEDSEETVSAVGLQKKDTLKNILSSSLDAVSKGSDKLVSLGKQGTTAVKYGAQ